jgi:hypothetical protein
MRPIGFSTGALALSDFRRGLDLVRRHRLPAVELSALRAAELYPLLGALGDLDLGGITHVSLHAPSRFDALTEDQIAQALRLHVPPEWPIVVHPDSLTRPDLWRSFGPRLCIENMDKRKPIGRTVTELEAMFTRYPEASLCFDIGHARQIDATMGVARDILTYFADRLRQVHLSEVNARCGHEPVSFTAAEAFRTVAPLIPAHIPIILETAIPDCEIETQVRVAARALPIPESRRPANVPVGFA